MAILMQFLKMMLFKLCLDKMNQFIAIPHFLPTLCCVHATSNSQFKVGDASKAKRFRIQKVV